MFFVFMALFYKKNLSFSIMAMWFWRGSLMGFLSFGSVFLFLSFLWYSPFDESANSVGYLKKKDSLCFYTQEGFHKDLLMGSSSLGTKNSPLEENKENTRAKNHVQHYGGSVPYKTKDSDQKKYSEYEDSSEKIPMAEEQNLDFQQRWGDYYNQFHGIYKAIDIYNQGEAIKNIMGAPGAYVADFCAQWFGYASFLLPGIPILILLSFFVEFSALGAFLLFFSLFFGVLLAQQYFFPRIFPFPFPQSNEKILEDFSLWVPSLWNCPAAFPNGFGVLLFEKNIYLFYIIVVVFISIPFGIFLPFLLRARGRFFWLWLQEYLQKRRRRQKEKALQPRKKNKISSLVCLNNGSSAYEETLQKAKEFSKRGFIKENKLLAYCPPPLKLLTSYPAFGIKSQDISVTLLQNVLKDFSIKGNVLQGHSGPIVTLYEFEPAPGVKSSRIVSLSDDIARSMGSLSARIAPIPGKNLLGIELSNKNRTVVHLKDLFLSKDYRENQSLLPLVLGRDISGGPIIVDLTKMPHLLIAGTTGSGKSVGINAMILSLLFRFGPQNCRFLMIDPKMLELSIYNGIPHLLEPVIIEAKKAIEALQWAVQEMENRYRLMSQMGVRNIVSYNQKLLKQKNHEPDSLQDIEVQVGFDENKRPLMEEKSLEGSPLPFIVVVVDEMADLMITAGKDVEVLVQRLAQMARAAGIHLIMATQRPSVDVITGTIKANFPTRISFQVASKIDSRTILGEQGAENLLGQGDMLYMPPGGRMLRVHGPFVSDEDITAVVSFLKGNTQHAPLEVFTEIPLQCQNNLPSQDDGSWEDDGETQRNFFQEDLQDNEKSQIFNHNDSFHGQEFLSLYDQAVALVTQENRVSIAALQKHLHIGYNQALELIEEMEKNTIVSHADALGRRHVLYG